MKKINLKNILKKTFKSKKIKKKSKAKTAKKKKSTSTPRPTNNWLTARPTTNNHICKHIEEKNTIKEIFRNNGEDYFRKIETKITLSELKKVNLTIQN